MNSAARAITLAFCGAVSCACSANTVDLDRTPTNPAPAGPTQLGAIERIDAGTEVSSFDVEGSRVFWQSGQIQSCEFERCAGTVVTYDVPVDAFLEGETADDVFVAYAGAARYQPAVEVVARCPRSGCTGGPQKFLEEDANAAWSPAFDASYLYWQSTFDLLRCPLSGCEGVPELVAKDQTGLGALSIGTDAVFYETFNVDVIDQWELHSAAKDGSEPAKTLVQVPNAIYRVYAVGPTAFYWLDNAGSIQSCPLAGCDGQPPTTVVSTATGKTSLRVDDSGIYWMEPESGTPGGGAVRYCPLAGCPATQQPIALNAPYITNEFALDAEYLYWTEYVPGGEEIQVGTGDPSNSVPFSGSSYIYRMQKPTTSH